jgi:hypothetical protein
MDPTEPAPAEPPPPRASGEVRPTPGEVGPSPCEVVRTPQRQLERPPSERYGAAAAPASPTGSVARAVVGAVGPAAVGAGLLVVLGSPLAIAEPLVVVALLLGLAAGAGARLGGGSRVAVPRRRAIAVTAAIAAVAVAEVVVWLLALAEGGVLPFLDYQWLVFGPAAFLQPVAAGLAAWATA